MGNACDQHLVHGLGRLPIADGTHVRDARTVGFEYRASTLENGRVTADHDGELAVLCAFHATRYGRIEEVRSHIGEDACGTLGRGGGDGRVIDNDAALLEGRGQCLDHTDDVRVRADA